jgi:hypothetical protein
MMKSFVFCLIAASLAGSATGQSNEPAIISKARKYRGSEAVLAAVKSIHLSGRALGGNVDNPDKPWVATVDIIFQKPWQESVLIRYSTQIVRTALDGYEGWRQFEDNIAGGQQEIDPNHASQAVVFSREQVENLRADTWYHLGFFRGIEETGGTITDAGPATIDGIACEKVVFTHSPVVVYTRYFDRSTGRLVYTETGGGARIHESGEVIVGGIRFPKTIVTSQSDRSGKVASSTYTFEKITLNEVFPASYFAVPLARVINDTQPLFAPSPEKR